MHPPDFIEPCLPTISRSVPTGGGWANEILRTQRNGAWPWRRVEEAAKLLGEVGVRLRIVEPVI
jgi:hypothetical protein